MSEIKPGDKVTVNADGFDPAVEWQVWNEIPAAGLNSLQVLAVPSTVLIRNGKRSTVVTVPTDTLTPVAPPLPPEPPVGSVVRADGRLWLRHKAGWVTAWTDGTLDWADLATAPDLSPVVAVDDVARWLANRIRQTNPDGRQPTWLQRAFRAEFGGWDK